MKIVIIEDEVDLGILMRKFLQRQIQDSSSNSIKIATTLADGLAFIEEIKPNWVLLDNNLPDGKGLDNIESIKAFESNPHIIMMSAMTNLREEAIRRGADHFLDKPISFTEIKKILEAE
ncbi:hypothetical protein GCM10027275_19240 [Rhabdobacter roseus]|uniref:DNA-binding response OmpR family regulator n=1 Tax=Rhabdobacter roseus TaxID=1655419 RepID=A0A840TV73_9BACT|nr:response regulator [Rhabdobacter roseus]MBB5283850.1 DNA-binding response OmpR family regulator [Rhabdobacter roseus]